MHKTTKATTLKYIEYKSNFLKNVIFRLDFSKLNELENNIEPKLTSAISAKYHAPIQNTIKELEVSFSPDGAKTVKEKTSRVWQYTQKDCSNKTVSLQKNAFIFECRNSEYKNFITFKNDIEFIFSKFLDNYAVSQFTRMGLRYINEIFIPEKSPLNWDGFINPNLCKAIEAGITSEFLPVRSMHQLQVKNDEITIMFNYGIFNRDYPNPIAKPELILDYDYYIDSLLDKNEVLDKLTDLNSLSKQMFESSIEGKLREKMGVVNG
jgi:uncharacterized protein (TIGR04255 family)